MIYIDPPYNTGNDKFIYPDKFSETKEVYLSRVGDKDESGYMTREGMFRKNSKDSGHYHSNWLSMMYPRLFLARNLLRDDGVIFVSIGDDEVHNLRLMMNEIFGEENFICSYMRISKRGSSMGKFFSPSFDYVVCYAKNILSLKGFTLLQTDEYKSKFNKSDEKGDFKTAGLYQSSLDPMRGCNNQRYYIKCPDGTLVIPPGVEFPIKKVDGEKIEPKMLSHNWFWHQKYSFFFDLEHYLPFFFAQFWIVGQPQIKKR
jgi:adenine-specific DNA-methyltransferase